MKTVKTNGITVGLIKPTGELDKAESPLFGYYPVGTDAPTFKGKSYQGVAWYLTRFLGQVTLED